MKAILIPKEEYLKIINREVGRITKNTLGNVIVELYTDKFPDIKKAKYLIPENENGGILSNYLPLKIGETDFINDNILPSDIYQLGVYDKVKNKIGKIVDISLLQPEFKSLNYRFGLFGDVYSNNYINENNLDNEYNYDLKNAVSFMDGIYTKFNICVGNISYNLKTDIEKFYSIYNQNTTIPLVVCKGNYDNKNLYDELGKIDNIYWKTYTFPNAISSHIVFDSNYIVSNGDSEVPITTETDIKINVDRIDPNNTSNYVYIIDNNGNKDVFICFSVDYRGKSSKADITNRVHHYYNQSDIDWLHLMLNEFRNERCFVITNLFFENEAGDVNGLYSSKHIDTDWLYNDSEDVVYTKVLEKFKEKNIVIKPNQLVAYYKVGSSGPAFLQAEQLMKLNRYYKNSIWISGHSNFKWDVQSYERKKANISYNKENNIRSTAYNMHMPSLVSPTGLPTDDGDLHLPKESEGAYISVYHNYVDVNGIDFKSYDTLINTFRRTGTLYVEANEYNALENITTIVESPEDNMLKVTLKRNGSTGFKISKGFSDDFINKSDLSILSNIYLNLNFAYAFYDKNGRIYDKGKEISTPLNVDTTHIGFVDINNKLTLENSLMKIYNLDGSTPIRGCKFIIENGFWNQFDETVDTITFYIECYLEYIKNGWGYGNKSKLLSQYRLNVGGINLFNIESNLNLLDGLKPLLDDDDIHTKYYIKFRNNGIINENLTQEITILNQVINVPDGPTKESFIFDGWYIEAFDNDERELSGDEIKLIPGTKFNNDYISMHYSEEPHIYIYDAKFVEAQKFNLYVAVDSTKTEFGNISVTINGGEPQVGKMISKQVDEESQVKLKGIPVNDNYKFGSWSNGSTDSEITTYMTEDINISCTFITKSYQLKVSCLTEQMNFGKVSVTNNGTVIEDQIVNTLVLATSNSVILKALPNEGYEFVKWNDGNTNIERTVQITQNSIFTCEFKLTPTP